jgi:Tol biopolymer transport system component
MNSHPHIKRLRLAASLLIIASLLFTQTALAAYTKLSAPPPFPGGVQDFKISPDGQRVVYRANASISGAYELYSVPTGGGTPVKLNLDLTSGRFVESDFQFSPDSSRVVYRMNRESSTVIDLYSVPIDGPASSSVKLNQPLNGEKQVEPGFQISPDGSQVVYRADQNTAGKVQVYSVPIAGPASAGIDLSGPMAGGGAMSIAISPDGQTVVYMADQTTALVFELFSAPIGGPSSAVIKLNDVLPASGAVYNYQIAAGGGLVVYTANQRSSGVIEIFAVPITGPGTESYALNPEMVGAGDVSDFVLSPDGNRVVYRADQDTNDVSELYSVPITGSGVDCVKLSPPPVANGDVLLDYAISPDSSRVVFLGDLELDGTTEVFGAPIIGPATQAVKLNGALATNSDVVAFKITPNSQEVVYRADQDAHFRFELYRVPIAGPAGAGAKVNDPTAYDNYATYFEISADSQTVFYMAEHNGNYIDNLYAVPLAGPNTSSVKLNGTLVTDGSVMDFKVSSANSLPVYRADQEIDETFEVYAADYGQPSVQFGASALEANEADGVLNVPVTLDRGLLHAITVDYSVTGGTAVADEDYTLAPGALTFNAGQALKSIPLVLIDDPDIEPDKTIVLTLSNPVSATLGAPAVITVTLHNNDFPNLAFQQATLSVGESAGSMQLIVQLSKSSPLTTTVGITATGTVSPGLDYTLTPWQLVFAPNQITQTITLTITNDAFGEPDETLTLTLTAPNNASLGAPASVTVTITDDDWKFVFLPLVVRKY